ncbi:MAG: hypothetical protein JWR45_3837, partial [Blastococcus sp.]|nr:hypothetical protein [Blastococcus sp.]
RAGQTILVRNHELQPESIDQGPFGAKNELLGKLDPKGIYDRGRGIKPSLGGTTTLIYDHKTQTVQNQFLSLAGTIRNCAGGTTPWGSWLTCEETAVSADNVFERDHGYVFEVPSQAQALVEPVALKAMGRFSHEAVVVDPRNGIIYETEDRNDGLFYRFIPNTPNQLTRGGRLQALVVRDKKSADTRNWLLADGGAGRQFEQSGRFTHRYAVEWSEMDEVEAPKDDLRARGFAAGAARFARGEGIVWDKNAVYFACTNGGPARKGQIWRYIPSPVEGTAQEKNQPGYLELFIEADAGTLVENADNLCVAPWGDLVVCEDGSAPQYVVGVTPQGQCYHIAKNALNSKEFAGATFSPDGSTLFVNIYQPGVTLAITGPWQNATQKA